MKAEVRDVVLIWRVQFRWFEGVPEASVSVNDRLPDFNLIHYNLSEPMVDLHR